MEFGPRIAEEIMTALAEHGVKQPCPRCNSDNWLLVDGFLQHTISDTPGSMVLGGPTIATIALVCRNCGFISEHSTVVLGIDSPHSHYKVRKNVSEAAPNSDASRGEA